LPTYAATQADLRIEELHDHLESARLVWFGIRGTDAAPLLRIPQFAAAFSIVDRLEAASLETSVSLEALTRRRVDLDAYDIDLDPSDAAHEFRGALLRAVRGRTIIASYRPSYLAESVTLAGGTNCSRAGMFKERQVAYEFKPWVELELAARGANVIQWRHVADEYRSLVLDMLSDGPIVLRATRGSGGNGITILRSFDDLDLLWPSRADGIVSVARYIEDATPVNVAGCIYSDGTVTVHPLSLQLIGVPNCTDRVFGYCGNDFGAARSLNDTQIREVEDQFAVVGRWLAETGYVGAFGLDLLVTAAEALITEINPRLQGSSSLSSELCGRIDVPDIVTEHVAAGLGLAPPARQPRLAELVQAIESVAQVIVHAPMQPADVISVLGAPDRVELEPPKAVETIDEGAAIARLIFSSAVTADGYSLHATR
jgi:hypothetical protein